MAVAPDLHRDFLSTERVRCVRPCHRVTRSRVIQLFLSYHKETGLSITVFLSCIIEKVGIYCRKGKKKRGYEEL